MCWIYKQAKSCRSFFVTLASLCFLIFLVFVFYFIEVGEIFLNTEEIHEMLCVFDIVAHWLSVLLETIKKEAEKSENYNREQVTCYFLTLQYKPFYNWWGEKAFKTFFLKLERADG